MADCLKYPLVLPTLGLSIRATLNRVIGHHANELRAFVETNSLNFMNRLVHSGRFVGFLTRLGIEEFLKAGSLAFIELSELGPGTEQFVVVTDAHSNISLAAQTLLDYSIKALSYLQAK